MNVIFLSVCPKLLVGRHVLARTNCLDAEGLMTRAALQLRESLQQPSLSDFVRNTEDKDKCGCPGDCEKHTVDEGYYVHNSVP